MKTLQALLKSIQVENTEGDDVNEARYVTSADYRVSPSGRKIHKRKKIADDDYNQEDDLDKDGDNDEDDERLKKRLKKESAEIEEARVANSASTRAELNKRPAKPLTGKDAEDKKKRSDAAWERLMAYASSQGKPVKEGFEHIDEANEYKVYSNSHNNPEHHTKHSTLDSAKAELAKHNGGALYHKNKLYNKKTGMFESVELEQFDDEAFYDGSDMLGEAKERYSSSYQFTHKPGDEESEKKLSDLKKSVKGSGKRVVLQGRLGKDNPNAHKYSKANWGKPGSASSGAHTHQRIKKADAAHHDVYVYDKADTQYDADTISEAVSVKKQDYSWGKMVTVHHGSDTSYPLHPEHQSLIKKLKDGEHASFTDETNRKVKAHREGDNVHLSSKGTSKKTTVAHSHFNESVEMLDEASDQQEARLLLLARLGLVDKANVPKLRMAIGQLNTDKALSIKQRELIISTFQSLVDIVTGDDAIFTRVRMDVQKESKEVVPFDGPYKKIKDVATDKSGAKHSAVSRVRHLARLALKKQSEKK